MSYIPDNLRNKVLERAKRLCEYCKLPEEMSGIPLEVDHIIPQSETGETSSDNLAASCRTCNSHKSSFLVATDPETANEVPLFHPRYDDWFEHFAWAEIA